MRPKTKHSELPSSHDIGVYLHNECVKWLEKLRGEIQVSSQRDRMTSEEHLPVLRQHLARFRRQLMDGQQIIPKQRSWG
jgi:hypothetical protein